MKDHNNIEENLEYLGFFGLRKNPFPVAPDDANFYLSHTIEEIIAEIVHGICARKGFILLTGEVGLGKTTITRRILHILETKDVRTSLVFHTALKDVDLLREINRDFGLPVDGAHYGHQLGHELQRLNDYLVEQYRQGNNCAIIIDDAQNLDRSSLELVRMISNLEVDQRKIVQILLVGQTELITTLNARSMRQLHSRIVIRKVVRSLSANEMRGYIAFKLNTSGNQGKISLTPAAFRRIFKLTRGNFRRVNLLMDRCLYAICHAGSHCITRSIVQAADADLKPGKLRRRKPAMAIAASIVVPLLLAIGSWTGHLFTGRSLMAAPVDSERLYKVPREVPAIRVKTSNAEPRMKDQQFDPAIDPAIDAFLGIYQLDRYGRDFQRVLKYGGLDALTQRIYGETGYQLVRLASLPDSIRKRYGALTFALGPNQPPTWLLFWQPKLELKRFYHSYRGKEIYQLQKRLKEMNFYRYRVDGIVGKRLVKAVIAFQKQSGLPVTGFPDSGTLFWVCHQQETIVNG